MTNTQSDRSDETLFSHEPGSAYAQGDVLLLRVADAKAGDPTQEGTVVLARGEHTGHKHAFYAGALMFRDYALARDFTRDLYIGHVHVAAGGALLEHGPGPGQRGDHDPIHVPAGTYIALRQREYIGWEARTVLD